MQLEKPYMQFYVLGRGDDVLRNRDVDEVELADQVMNGHPVREVCAKVADAVGAKLEHDRAKRDWIAGNREAIDDAGGDAEKAYAHYVQGRKDEYAWHLEEDVVDALYEEEDEDEEDDEEGEDEEDDEP